MNNDLSSADNIETRSAPLPPMQRDEAIIPSGTGAAAQRELYGALMKGFGEQEQGSLEHMMIDNIERLRDDGDSYAP